MSMFVPAASARSRYQLRTGAEEVVSVKRHMVTEALGLPVCTWTCSRAFSPPKTVKEADPRIAQRGDP